MQTHLLIVGENTSAVVEHAKSSLPEGAVKKIIAADSPHFKHQ